MRDAIKYRDFEIYPNRNVPAIPGWRAFSWVFTHKDHDADDTRGGYGATPEECKTQIDLWHEEQGD